MAEQVPRGFRDAERSAPAGVRGGQYLATPDGDECVVFLVGMRINRWRRVRSWWGPFTAMPRMLAQLQAHPEAGLLGARSFWSGRVLMVIQYWRSAEHLGAYARDSGLAHQPAWAAFNSAGAGSGDVGLFHETYVVPAQGVESLYANMPAFGLGLAHSSVPRRPRARTRAQERMGQRDPEFVDPAP